MSLISRILAPVVFSERCQDATRYAAALACRFHCDLTLLHVFVQPWAAYSSPEGYATPPPYDLSSTLAQVKEQLDAFLRDELATLPAVYRVLTEGDPAQVIAQYAASQKCDLIVMPTHGYGPFRRFLLGSVTAKVLHDVNCAVFTGPHLEHPPALESPRFQKILCAVDLGPQSPGVIEWASRFAREFGSTIGVVYAIPTSTTRLEGVYFDPQWRIDLCANARREMESLMDQSQVKGEIVIEIGDPDDAVREVAETTGADLVVIGRGHTHGMLGRLRTNAYGIVRESPCPVVAV